jgi:hypothetical protein
METIKSVREAIGTWRREHRRGPLPVVLRRRVAELAREVGEDEARRAVGIPPAITRRSRAKQGAGGPRRRRTRLSEALSPFVELRPALGRQMNVGSSPPGLRIELTGPAGYRVRIEGARDATEVAAIVRATVRGA